MKMLVKYIKTIVRKLGFSMADIAEYAREGEIKGQYCSQKMKTSYLEQVLKAGLTAAVKNQTLTRLP